MGEHWYKQDGSPFYETTDAKGNLRSVTLRDARKIGAVPSVTTVLGVIAKPNLDRWSKNQAILAALTMPRNQTETEDAYIARIHADSDAQRNAAAEEGSRVHDAIEQSYRGGNVPARYWATVNAVRERIHQMFPEVNDWVPEASFASKFGYGGKVDLHSPSTGIVIDYKGKDGDLTDKLAWEQHYQLAAYNRGLNLPPTRCANVFFSRTIPGCVNSHVWALEQVFEGWDVFEAALMLWKRLRKYDPSNFQTGIAA